MLEINQLQQCVDLQVNIEHVYCKRSDNRLNSRSPFLKQVLTSLKRTRSLPCLRLEQFI